MHPNKQKKLREFHHKIFINNFNLFNNNINILIFNNQIFINPIKNNKTSNILLNQEIIINKFSLLKIINKNSINIFCSMLMLKNHNNNCYNKIL